jgi:hypothetical protein
MNPQRYSVQIKNDLKNTTDWGYFYRNFDGSFFQTFFFFFFDIIYFYLIQFCEKCFHFLPNFVANFVYQLILQKETRDFFTENFFTVIIVLFSIFNNLAPITSWITGVLLVNFWNIFLLTLRLIDKIKVFIINLLYNLTINLLSLLFFFTEMVFDSLTSWIKTKGNILLKKIFFNMFTFLKKFSRSFISFLILPLYLFLKIIHMCNVVFTFFFQLLFLKKMLHTNINPKKENCEEKIIRVFPKRNERKCSKASKEYKKLFSSNNVSELNERLKQPIDGQIYKFR